jgi:UDP-glucuronate 4-epimerase
MKLIAYFVGLKAIRNYIEMQHGDVPTTWADLELVRLLTGYAPKIKLADGVEHFVDWYKAYHCG